MMIASSNHVQRLGAVFAAIAILAAPDHARADPSFDCARATQADEFAICADPTLARVDSMVAEAYRGFVPDFQSRGTVARALLRQRQSCGGDAHCILAAQYQTLQNFDAPALWVENVLIAALSTRAADMIRSNARPAYRRPEQAGECVRTRIESVTTRFGNALSSNNVQEGIAIRYAAGLGVVDYDRSWRMDHLAPGHDVVVCLMSIPFDCPQGDDRGRLYYNYHPGAQIQWIMTDTQHMCGGA